MKLNQSGIKYIEWRSPEDLHEDTLHAVSEIRFIKDEQLFLEELIKNHTLDLIREDLFEKSKGIIADLSKHRKESDPLLKRLLKHGNDLQMLFDEVDVPDELKNYKQKHYELMFEVVSYYAAFKKCKRSIFNFIRKIIREHKQQRLLSP